MKLTQLSGLLAIGLGVTPAAASICRPSKVSSSVSSSVAPSSVSSSSASASASASAVCDPNANIIVNGDLSDGLDSWEYDSNLFAESSGCGPYSYCADFYFGGGTVKMWQVIPTVIGATYHISFAYDPNSISDPAHSSFTITIAGAQTTSITPQVGASTPVWTTYGTTFQATAPSTTVTFVVSAAYQTKLYLTNIVIAKTCSEAT